MSKETHDALEQALRNHLQDEHNVYLTEWIICTSSVVAAKPDMTRYEFPSSGSLTYHNALGLLYTALKYIDGDLQDDEWGDD